LILAQRLREKVEENIFLFNETQIRVTISLGAAGIPENNPSSNIELIRFADEALYVAKKSGRNRVESCPTK